MNQIARACLIILCLAAVVISKPGAKRIDFSELDRLVPEELKEKNTPGAVITIISGDQVIYQKAFGVKFDGKEKAMTKTGEKKFTFGEQNENEVVFVSGKSGRIEFLFFELYGAKKIK